VTRSGTNSITASVYRRMRNESYVGTEAAAQAFNPGTFTTYTTGVWAGGPIMKNKLFAFGAYEKQDDTRPLTTFQSNPGGVPVGGNVTRVLTSDMQGLRDYLLKNFNYDTGAFDNISRLTPGKPWMVKGDYNVNSGNKVTFRYNQLDSSTDVNQSGSASLGTSRQTGTTQFLTFANSNYQILENLKSGVGEWNSVFGAMTNNLLVGYTHQDESRGDKGQVPLFPFVVIGDGTGGAYTSFGNEPFTPFNLLRYNTFQAQDSVTKFAGKHSLTFGGNIEKFHSDNSFYFGIQSAYSYNSLADFYADANGYLANPNRTVAAAPSRFQVKYLLQPGQTTPPMQPLDVLYGGGYVQDEWRPRSNLTVTAGLRVDVPRFGNTAFDNPVADTLTFRDQDGSPVQYNSGALPDTTAYWSPRVGFNWDIHGNQTDQLRANAGIFTGPPPFILVANALQNTGLGLVRLSCTAAAKNVPAFTVDESNLPHACAGQQPPANGQAGTVGVNLNDPNFKYPQSAVLSGGYDHLLPFGFVATAEALYRHAINGIRIRDLNLMGPRMVNGQILTDRNGRVLYADTISSSGSVTNTNQRAITSVNGTAFSEGAIYLTNQSKDYNYTLTGQLKKSFSNGLAMTGAYTYNRAYDIQSLTSDRAISNWRNGREYSGLESEDALTTSVFERRHRILLYGSYTMPWMRQTAPTELTFYFERQSGQPVTYVSNQDLNGDGYNGNDPIYVPKDARDQNEILLGSMTSAGVFTPDTAAQTAFENFVSSQPCLNAQRGQIMKRNSCFTPWQNRLDMSVRQALPTVRGQHFSAQLDVMNAANAIGKILEHVDGKDRNWGRFYNATLSSFPQQTVLSGNTSGGSIARSRGPLSQSQPVYTFNSTVRSRGPYDFANNLGYLMQLTFRYDF